MLLGRKKKKEQEKDDGEENELHKGKSLLEYQNKCLCTKIDDLNEKLSQQEKTNKNLDKKFSELLNFFSGLNQKLVEINTAVDVAIAQNGIEFKTSEENSKEFSSPSKIISSILSQQNPSSEITIVNDLEAAIQTLCEKILPVLKENQKNLIKKFEKSSEELINLNKSLEEKTQNLSETCSKYLNDVELLKSQKEISESKLKEMNIEIDKLNSENFNLKRKVNSHPTIPYIQFEKRFFEKQIEEHKCVCMVCAKEMNSNPNPNNGTDNEMTAVTATIPKPKEDEAVQLLTKENEALKLRIKELYDNLETMSTQNEFTEENLVSSKRFQSLISQAENILSKLDSLKEVNSELQKKNFFLNQVKETEVNKLSQKFMEKLENFKKATFDSSKLLEANKHTIQMLINKVESLEAIIKAKDTDMMHSMYDIFVQERTELMKQMEQFKMQKKENLSKYEEEKAKNKANENTIYKLTNEIEDLKKLLQNNNVNPDDKKWQYDYTNDVIKRKKEKITSLKKEVSRLNNELMKERNQNENMSEITETNEKSITDLNKQLINANVKLQEYKQTQAKMLNEKLKDSQTIALYEEKQEISEKKIISFQDQIENFDSYTKKLEVELNEQKKLANLLNQNLKNNEVDIENLKNANIEHLKVIERQKEMIEDLQKEINELKNSLSKQTTNYDALKIKYDGICKIKNFDPSIMSYEKLQNDNDILTRENQRYREMLHCQVCRTKIKNVVITKCFHCFCRTCVEETFEGRKRKCPICREQITQNDVHEIFWN